MKAMPYMKLNPHLPEIIEELRDERYRPHPSDIRTAVDELESMARRIDALEELTERLTAERDEARREACGHDETIGGAMLEADRRGWDCFKENT
jgi:Arc/MetJ-type ribon-helix-helix transcriptional regulator